MVMFRPSPRLPSGFPLSPALSAPIVLRPLMPSAEWDADGGESVLLAGGPLRCAAFEIFLHGSDVVCVTRAGIGALRRWAAGEGEEVRDLLEEAMAALSAPRPSFAGLRLDAPRVVGVVNVTPDSFYDGGAHETTVKAIAHGRKLIAEGADMLDIGGESTRPGSAAVDEAAELDRVIPVIRALTGDGVPISIDTRRPGVIRAALAAGAVAVNDVTALAAEGAIEAVAEARAGAILMHMQGSPETMQQDPTYDHAPYEVFRFLESRVAACEAAGIPRSRLCVDPGIGFGKTLAHNAEIMGAFALYQGLGCAVMAGLSRKSFIDAILPGTPAEARLPGTLAATTVTAGQGAQLHRVHDVAEARQALAVWRAIAAPTND
jgi:dihydropteroate synthase